MLLIISCYYRLANADSIPNGATTCGIFHRQGGLQAAKHVFVWLIIYLKIQEEICLLLEQLHVAFSIGREACRQQKCVYMATGSCLLQALQW